MHFEGRDLPPHIEPIESPDLKEGIVYFFVNYFDDTLLIPRMETVVFIGRDLEPGDSGKVYFQDIDSYRRGVRSGDPNEGEVAYVFSGLETEMGHIFRFDKALEELMRCSLRRSAKGEDLSMIPRTQQGLVSSEEPPESAEERQTHSLRFEDPALQARLIDALRNAGLSFDTREDGAVTCTATDWQAINTVAGKIRDSLFPWYMSWWKDTEAAQRYLKEMRASGLPFQVEHCDDKIIFLLPKGSEDLHQTVAERIVEPGA